MSETQKIIKYVALALAFFLISTILSGIFYGLKTIIYIFDGSNLSEELFDLDVKQGITSLEIDVDSIDLEIKNGDSFKVETNNKDIELSYDDSKLEIEEDNLGLFGDSGKLIIYIPSDINFEDVDISTGAGRVIINTLSTDKLFLELGAGKVSIDNLTVNKETSIESGAGEFTINSSKIKDLDLDMGVGKVSINSEMIGYNKIDSGIGKLELNLIGNNYKIIIDKGIGSSTINGNSVSSGTIYEGESEHTIDINGGIGNIEVKTNQ